MKETIGAFREVSSAQEDKERIIVNAQRLLVSLTPQAHGNADYEVKQADGEAYRRVKGAGAEADALRRVSGAVRSAPEVLQNMLWREKLEIALSHNSKIIVPEKGSLAKVALWKRKSPGTRHGAHMPARGKHAPGEDEGHGGKNGVGGKSGGESEKSKGGAAHAGGDGKKQTGGGHGESATSAGGAPHGANSRVNGKSSAARPEKPEGETTPGAKNRGNERSAADGAAAKQNVARNASIAGANQTGREKR